ncbi:uracil-DNA glycosylase-like isoform X2 [Montipora foliosa]|uniref:uracil-DNA glycosylase-like isoform X2 n=1 Tax=Montipora foliosa TaxID=591990 RepID=UPI0035F0FFDF
MGNLSPPPPPPPNQGWENVTFWLLRGGGGGCRFAVPLYSVQDCSPLLPSDQQVSTNHMQHLDYTLLDKIISLECGMIYQRRSDPPLCIADFKKLRAFLQIKVVIIGQDPYHGPRQAHGLCFSVPPGVGIPPSLVNIYKELENDIDGFQAPKHGYLTGWAKQGVLLLNACLTVVASKANSHKDKGWEQFTDAVIRWINSNLTGVVFLLWGAYAQKKGSFIDKKKHCVLKAVHPSPLSAHRGFLGCKHFSQANQYLKKVGKKAIDWRSLPVDQNENFSA